MANPENENHIIKTIVPAVFKATFGLAGFGESVVSGIEAVTDISNGHNDRIIGDAWSMIGSGAVATIMFWSLKRKK